METPVCRRCQSDFQVSMKGIATTIANVKTFRLWKCDRCNVYTLTEKEPEVEEKNQ